MNVRDGSQGIVHEWYRKRGIVPRFIPTSDQSAPPVGRPYTDDERRLLWMRAQVAPVLTRLSKQWGKEDLVEWLFSQLPLEQMRDRAVARDTSTVEAPS